MFAPKAVAVSGNYAYVSSYMSSALEIVDISDPTFPVHKNKILDGEFDRTDPPYVPDPPPNITPPSVTSYTFNAVADNIITNPLASPLSLVINASENVDWTSVKIENQDNASIYKIFYSGGGCVNGTNTCTKSWNGLLTRGGLLQNGTFRVKLHIKDPSNNKFYDYLSPYVITVNTN